LKQFDIEAGTLVAVVYLSS